MAAKKKKVGFFDRPQTKKKLWFFLWGLCVLTVFLEIPIKRYGHFGDHSIDGYFGFYAALGFGACVVSIFVSKILGVFLKAKPDYYEDEE